MRICFVAVRQRYGEVEGEGKRGSGGEGEGGAEGGWRIKHILPSFAQETGGKDMHLPVRWRRRWSSCKVLRQGLCATLSIAQWFRPVGFQKKF